MLTILMEILSKSNGVSDYDLSSENIESLKLQYRKDGLSDWFTSAEVDIDSLNFK